MADAAAIDAKEQVRQSIDIVDLVGGYIQLQRQGKIYKGLCPWHDDSRPSLQVDPARQTFRCWVCDLGGDIFSFVMRQENLNFPEALAMLAERAGISLAPQRGVAGPSSGDIDKNLLYRAMAWAEEKFYDCLAKDDSAAPARDYLKQRGVSI